MIIRTAFSPSFVLIWASLKNRVYLANLTSPLIWHKIPTSSCVTKHTCLAYFNAWECFGLFKTSQIPIPGIITLSFAAAIGIWQDRNVHPYQYLLCFYIHITQSYKFQDKLAYNLLDCKSNKLQECFGLFITSQIHIPGIITPIVCSCNRDIV